MAIMVTRSTSMRKIFSRLRLGSRYRRCRIHPYFFKAPIISPVLVSYTLAVGAGTGSLNLLFLTEFRYLTNAIISNCNAKRIFAPCLFEEPRSLVL
jgi:hypothetical protein